jgi:hypothetical protein
MVGACLFESRDLKEDELVGSSWDLFLMLVEVVAFHINLQHHGNLDLDHLQDFSSSCLHLGSVAFTNSDFARASAFSSSRINSIDTNEGAMA